MSYFPNKKPDNRGISNELHSSVEKTIEGTPTVFLSHQHLATRLVVGEKQMNKCGNSIFPNDEGLQNGRLLTSPKSFTWETCELAMCSLKITVNTT